ncbi:DUF3718 domain-containing protein [Thalassotalea psychrophila]|uniref:DUF3718 domain-containing protein n=1 Tax=Thalassotalea psychrophila TaxID=3065647 RepID=A0ABY9TVZ5_9GAMM|nr:DUF3718 domain-containing protein [Colwelliaceae bacterium SQ149]
MKATRTFFLFIIAFVLLSFKAYANNVTFEAGDNSTATKLCIAAGSNNLHATQKYIKSLSWQQTGMYQKTNSVLAEVSCNKINLIEFTAQYDADKTYNFLNDKAMNKYKLTDDQMKIIDIAKVNDLPQVIVVTSR